MATGWLATLLGPCPYEAHPAPACSLAAGDEPMRASGPKGMTERTWRRRSVAGMEAAAGGGDTASIRRRVSREPGQQTDLTATPGSKISRD